MSPRWWAAWLDIRNWCECLKGGPTVGVNDGHDADVGYLHINPCEGFFRTVLIPLKRMWANAFLRFKKDKCPVQIPQTAPGSKKVVLRRCIISNPDNNETSIRLAKWCKKYLWVRVILFDTFRYPIFEFPTKNGVVRKCQYLLKQGSTQTGYLAERHIRHIRLSVC